MNDTASSTQIGCEAPLQRAIIATVRQIINLIFPIIYSRKQHNTRSGRPPYSHNHNLYDNFSKRFNYQFAIYCFTTGLIDRENDCVAFIAALLEFNYFFALCF